MSEASSAIRQPDLYWRALVQLKAASVCIRLCRNRLATQVRWVDGIKAVASSGGIAAWVVWREYPFLWAGIIAAAQLLDAVKHVFLFSRQHRAACDLTVALELLFIESEYEWARIYAGGIPGDAILEARRKMQQLQLEAEHKYFPEGFEPSAGRVALAADDARA